MIHNSGRTGGGFLVSPLSTVNDGLLELITVEPLSVLRRFFYLPKIQRGKHLHLPFVHHEAGTSFNVVCKHIVPAQLDGELIYAQKFSIEVARNKFLFRF
jgi:diacylglycerol kinase family enzyme